MEYSFINIRTVPLWRAKMRMTLQNVFGHKTEIVRISDSPSHTDQVGSLPGLDFDSLLQMLCIDSDSLKFNKRLRWIGDIEMKNGFINKYHERCFEQVIHKLNTGNSVLISAVYLLTADYKIWKQARRHIERDRICFGAFKPVNCTENGYTVYCAAKDAPVPSEKVTGGSQAQEQISVRDTPKRDIPRRNTDSKKRGSGESSSLPELPEHYIQEVRSNRPS